MYEFIRGVLQAKNPSALVLDVSGIGYRILISTKTFDVLPEPQEEVQLFLHHTFHAEQGEQRLYGFLEEQDRLLFRQLLSVQRVGPSVALRILSNVGTSTFVNAIQEGNLQALKGIKGVGGKMAERLVVELKEPLGKLGLLFHGKTLSSSRSERFESLSPATENSDAIAALVQLGYKPVQAEKAVRKAAEKVGADASSEKLIRLALQIV